MLLADDTAADIDRRVELHQRLRHRVEGPHGSLATFALAMLAISCGLLSLTAGKR